MKNLIDKKLALFFLILGITAFAFNATKIFNKSKTIEKNSTVSKKMNVFKNQQNSKANTVTTINNPQQDIIGVWIMENSTSDKWIFTNNNILNRYEDNVLINTSYFEFVDFLPNGNQIPAGEYLIKFTDQEDGSESFHWVFDVSPNTGDYLTLISEDNGGIVHFIKQ